MDINEMEQRLKTMLRPERFEHSLGVRDSAAALARRWGADVDKAAVAGLLHDCAKHVPEQQSRAMLLNIKDKLDNITLSEKKLWHAPLGAEMAKTVFGVEDGDIYDAIFYHTVGKEDMPLLTKIIYIADMIEPGRDREFAFTPQLREDAFIDLDRAIVKSIDYTLKSVIQRGLLMHQGTVAARNSLILKLRQRINAN